MAAQGVPAERKSNPRLPCQEWVNTNPSQPYFEPEGQRPEVQPSRVTSSQSEVRTLAYRAEEKRPSSGRGRRGRHLSPHLRHRQPVVRVPPVSSSEPAPLLSPLGSVVVSAFFPEWIWSECLHLNPGPQQLGDPISAHGLPLKTQYPVHWRR